MLRTPKGWTGPKVVDGLPVEGTFRAHQVPLADVRDNPDHLDDARSLDAQLPAGGAVRRERPAHPRAGRARAEGDRRMGANPHANGGKLLVDLDLPDFRDYAIAVTEPGHRAARVDAPARQADARHLHAQREAEANFRLFCPDETNSNRLGDVFEVENRCFVGPDHRRSTTTSRRTAG